MRLVITTLTLLNICFSNYSQSANTDSSSLGIGHIISIKSRYVKDETYIINIHLPSNYQTSGKSYPVLFLLDGDRSYGMTRDMSEWLNSTNEIEQFITVAVGYGEYVKDRPRRQIRDFTPSRDLSYKAPEYANSGGAKNFQLFILKELIPTIEARYPITKKKVLVGFEYGSLFGAFMLLSNPKTFSDYVLISPVLQWDNRYIFKAEQAYASLRKNLEANVFLIYGLFDSQEEIIIPANQFSETLQNNKYPDLSVSVRQYASETHYSVYPIALQYCIMNFFRK